MKINNKKIERLTFEVMKRETRKSIDGFKMSDVLEML